MGYENGYQNDGNVDAEEIDMSGTVYSPDLSNYVYQRNQPAYVSGSDSETYNEKFQITSVASNSQVVSGLYVCKSARSSGFTCGDIDEVNVSATACEQGTSICSNYTNFFGFAGCVAGGDSGGPIYDPSAHRAFGLVSYGPESTYFGCTSPSGQADGPMISNVLSTLGVTLNTTDQSVLF